MDRIAQITALIKQAGNDRKAVELIEKVRGVAPDRSAMSRARSGKGTPYILQCYIDDLTQALERE